MAQCRHCGKLLPGNTQGEFCPRTNTTDCKTEWDARVSRLNPGLDDYRAPFRHGGHTMPDNVEDY